MSATDEEKELLFDRQRERLRLLKGVMSQYNNLPKDRRTKGVISTLVKSIESTWAEYHAAHGEILRRIPAKERSEIPYFTELEYDTANGVYTLHRGVLLDFLEVFPEKKVAATGSSQTRRLPDLTAPKFDGDITKWVKFRDSFVSDFKSNSSISPAEKLSILMSCLSGNAAAVVADVDLSSGNFAAAWKALSDWYDNPALLVSSYIRQLILLPAAKDGSVAELQRVFHATIAHVGALRVLEREVDHWDDWLAEMTLMRLDSHSLELWEYQRGASRLPPTYDEVIAFFKSRISALERSALARELSAAHTSTTGKPKDSRSHGEQKPIGHKSHTVQREKEKSISCVLCKGQHRLMDCSDFLSKHVKHRIEFVKKKKRCLNCLGHHDIEDCKSTYVCQTCKARHHTLLHISNTAGVPNTQPSGRSGNATTPTPDQAASLLSNPRSVPRIAVLLATARLRVRNSVGTEIERLHLSRRRGDTKITGIGVSSAGSARGIVSLVCSPRFDSPVLLSVEAYVLHRLTSYKPSCHVFDGLWPHIQGLQLADPYYDAADNIDVLLGADVFAEIIQDGLIKGPPNSPVAQSTTLGWILSGAVTSSSVDSSAAVSQHVHCHQASIHELAVVVRKFWELEEIPGKRADYTQDEIDCEEHFRRTYYRTPEGRFCVSLPFKSSPELLGKSRQHAELSMNRMNRRFAKDAEFSESYQKFIQEYIDLGHLREVPDDGSTGVLPQCYYLSHHGIMQTSANVLKMRVVFSGSQPLPIGMSLNKILHVGPQLQRSLAEILLSWRFHLIVFSADIEKMYRQILMNPADWNWQRIIWRLHPGDLIRLFLLITVTYGLASSAFLSIRCLEQLAVDVSKKYPEISKLISKCFYVDDALAGSDDAASAINLAKSLSKVLKSGGFPLKKWTSNCKELLDAFPPEDRAATTSLTWSHGPVHKALGITWRPDQDDFIFLDKSTADTVCTKRLVMSRIAQLFDPLGWLSPISVRGKIFMRLLWSTKLGWDQQLPQEHQRIWDEYLIDLKKVTSISIPRWLRTSHECQWIEIHGFSDASKDAYSAAVYIRVKNSHAAVSSTLAMAKTRVSPLRTSTTQKPVSIARLELCGATLLCQLVKLVQQSLELESVPVHLWTDSKVTLYWISQDPGRWLVFVAHRVHQIQSILPEAKWHYIDGESNPADCASRGITTEQLREHKLWWHGPSMLLSSDSAWPEPEPLLSIPANLEEEVKTVQTTQTAEIWGIIYEFSSLRKLLRFTAWWQRYRLQLQRAVIRRKRHSIPDSDLPPDLTPKQLDDARLFWIHQVQQLEFQQEIAAIQQRSSISRRHLAKLAPFLDDLGILRVGGRLKHSTLDWEEVHPIILPSNEVFTQLVIEDCHLRTLHGGTQLMLSVLRRKYWIIGARVMIKSHIHKCVRCIRYRATVSHQQMGNLPSARVKPDDVFSNTGVDFAGPFSIRMSKGRGNKTFKGYICVFVCLLTRAVHLEAVSDYSTPAFLAAFRRFVSYHGIPSLIYSDQGTNFTGADAELKRMFEENSEDF